MTNAPFSDSARWVAFDLETTGLSEKADKIIEIGAVRFSARETLDEFQTFVNPNRQIPKFITEMTGIGQSDVNSAPTISDIGGEFEDFVAGATLIAHNASFDMGFLRGERRVPRQPGVRHDGTGPADAPIREVLRA